MITTRRAVVDDTEAISALLMANGIEQGRALYGDWSMDGLNPDALIVIATLRIAAESEQS